MIPWAFLAFGGVMGGILYLHFYFAHSRWRHVRGQETEDIDPSYVRREDYFGQSFRTKLQSWLDLPSIALPDGVRTIQKDGEMIRVSPALRLADRAQSDEIQAVQEDFSCGAASHLSREIYAAGNAAIGTGSKLQALAADGDVTLSSDVEIARWVDSWGALHLGRHCTIHSRATSRKSVYLDAGVQARSVFAPEVTTAPAAVDPARHPMASQDQRLQIPPPDGANRSALRQMGLDLSKLTPLGSECWIYAGSLRPRMPVHLTAQLVVKGDCSIPAGSVLENDLKASGDLFIGAGSECKGNLISEKVLGVGPGVHFGGIIHADGEILVGYGVRGESVEGPVAVDAGSWLYVEQGVTVRGKLSSGERVRVVAPPFAETWRRAHQPFSGSGLRTAK
jgi:predicted acyltransferase (DUF342 family)